MLDSLDTLIAFALIFTVVSLLITILVQVITSLLRLRGKNLAWGIAEAFEAMAPELAAQTKGKGKALADHLLKDPLISDKQIWNRVGPASAVRGDELFDLLHRIATGKKPDAPADIKAHAITLFKGLGVPANVFELADGEKAKLAALQADVASALAALPAGPAKEAMQKTQEDITARLAKAARSAEESAQLWAQQGEASIQHLYDKFQHWFDTGQERSQEWFTTHARYVTAALGVLFAVVLQLDTIEIYKLVSSNREVRASLVAQMKPVTDAAQKVLAEKSSGASGDVTNQLANLRDEYKRIGTNLDNSGFALFPSTPVKNFYFPSDWTWSRLPVLHWGVPLPNHLLGVFFSALLLSLGAPFWFNTLKSLASLRSNVAENISDEKKAGDKAPSSKPPPTVGSPPTPAAAKS